MAFFDDLGKKISQTSQGVVQKTKDTAEIMKLNGMISDEEKRIKNLYFEIGKAYFELHADSSEAAFNSHVDGIKDARAKIDEYSEQIKRLKGIGKCPNCGGDVPNSAPFCSACGLKMNIQNAAANPMNTAIPHCTNCGAPLKEGTAFCTNCGTKVTPPAAAPVPPVVPTPDAAPAPEVTPVQDIAPVPPAVPVPDAVPTSKSCPNCGKELAIDAKFCTGCGFKVEG